jgi:hypothetical protein
MPFPFKDSQVLTSTVCLTKTWSLHMVMGRVAARLGDASRHIAGTRIRWHGWMIEPPEQARGSAIASPPAQHSLAFLAEHPHFKPSIRGDRKRPSSPC